MRQWIAAVLLCLGGFASCGGGIGAEEISGELVGLPVSLVHEKQLVVFDQLVTAEQWGGALDVLDRLPETTDDVLVKVAPGHYINAEAAIQRRLVQLPVGGREAAARRQQTTAATLLARAKEEHDEQRLWRIAQRLASTPAAPLALHDLATQAAGRGDLEQALRLWGRLQLGPHTSRWQPPLPLYSLAITDESLKEAVTSKRQMVIDRLSAPRPSGIEAGANEDCPGAVVWSALATSNCPLTEYQVPVSVTPGIDGLVIVNNGEMIRAISDRDGEPYWPNGAPDDVGIVVDRREEVITPLEDVPCRVAGGMANADRYFGVIGDSPRWRPRPGLVPQSGSLVSLDLGRGEGRLVWRVEARDLPEAEWLFHGTPVLHRGRWSTGDLVVVPICRPGAQTELGVAAFSQDDGRVVWWTRIGVCAATPGDPLPLTQLRAVSGLVVARTLTGVIVTIDPQRGEIQWASTAMVSSPPEQTRSSAMLIDAHLGVLVVVDPVQSLVAGFSLDSGEPLWQKEIPDSLMGVVCGPRNLVLTAGKRLHALALTDGEPRWELGADDSVAGGTGVPCLAANAVLWPTRLGLLGIDPVSGELLFQRRLTAEPVALPMQLMSSPTRWFLSQPESVLTLTRSQSP